MRLGVDFRGDGPDKLLQFGKQMGAEDAVCGATSFDPDGWHFGLQELVKLKVRVESFGLKIAAIENVYPHWSDKIKLGLPGRDKQIENFCKTLKHMGKLEIPILGYNFMTASGPTNFAWRTSESSTGRGGAHVTNFDWSAETERFGSKLRPDNIINEYSDQDIWNNFEYFIKSVEPIAREAGVKLALHPDDPPISPLAGIARIFRDHSSLERLCNIVDSDYNGLEFCQGTVASMPGNVYDAITKFVMQGKVHYVHFRNVSGPVPTFSETFIDDGHVNMIQAMEIYQKLGFNGTFIDDHVPGVVGDNERYIGRAHAMGYIRALIDMVSQGK